MRTDLGEFKNTTNGWDESADAWAAHIDRGDGLREFVLDPALFQQLGNVSGKTAIDVGCGEGRLCRSLADRGVQITGIDPTKRLIELAKKRDPAGRYHEGFAENIPFPDGSFDIVLSYLVLLDVPDFAAAISEMARVLRPGGRLIYINLQAFATCSQKGWIKDGEGNRLHFAVDNYGGDNVLRAKWAGIDIANFHRPISSYFQAFLNQGLQLVHFSEPLVPAESNCHTAYRQTHFRIPFAYLTEWRKP